MFIYLMMTYEMSPLTLVYTKQTIAFIGHELNSRQPIRIRIQRPKISCLTNNLQHLSLISYISLKITKISLLKFKYNRNYIK